MIYYLIAAYLFLVILGWRYVHLVYSKKGVNYGKFPDGVDFFLIICPILNIIVAIGWIAEYPIKSEIIRERNKKLFSRIFLVEHKN